MSGDLDNEPATTTEEQDTTKPAPPRAPKPSVGPRAFTADMPEGAVDMPYRGVNLAGAEFGSAIPGVEGVDYAWPTTDEVDYFVKRGMNTFRIGFLWERLQPVASGEFVVDYAAKLDALVTHVTNAGATVILNPHNFARYYGQPIGSPTVPNSAFANLWMRLAQKYAANAHVMFNLTNEPNTMPSEQWLGAANEAIAAIRKAGASNTIIVPGNAWTGAHSWNQNWYGTPNAVVMRAVHDPADKVLFEVHQYLDETSGGKHGGCVSTTIGSERLAGFVKWLRDNGKKGFVGELAGGDNPTCDAAIKDMLDYMMASSDVLVGWAYWVAGPKWPATYPFNLEPVGGQDRPQMKRLAPYLFGKGARL